MPKEVMRGEAQARYRFALLAVIRSEEDICGEAEDDDRMCSHRGAQRANDTSTLLCAAAAQTYARRGPLESAQLHRAKADARRIRYGLSGGDAVHAIACGPCDEV